MRIVETSVGHKRLVVTADELNDVVVQDDAIGEEDAVGEERANMTAEQRLRSDADINDVSKQAVEVLDRLTASNQREDFVKAMEDSDRKRLDELTGPIPGSEYNRMGVLLALYGAIADSIPGFLDEAEEELDAERVEVETPEGAFANSSVLRVVVSKKKKKYEHSPTEHGFIDECTRKNSGKDDPGAYCASIVDKAKGGYTGWRKGPKKGK